MEVGYYGTTITTLDDLSSALSLPKAELVYFANNKDRHVHRITKTKKDGKTRKIYAPSKQLSTILTRIKIIFFDDYKYPEYVYGLGGNTLKDHANVHLNKSELVQADLTKFFPSIHYKLVYQMWSNDFSLPAPVARLLTMLTTIDGHLQQGFATSSHIAGVVAAPLTSALYNHCKKNSMAFSQYVDDLNFSGNNIDKRALFKILIRSARDCGLSVKKRKTGVLNFKTGKKITGVSVYGARVRPTKEVRQRAISALKVLREQPKNKEAQQSVKGYFGHLSHLNRKDGRSYKQKIKDIYR